MVVPLTILWNEFLFLAINLFTKKLINPVIELLAETGFASDSVLAFIFAQSIHGQTCNGKKIRQCYLIKHFETHFLCYIKKSKEKIETWNIEIETCEFYVIYKYIS